MSPEDVGGEGILNSIKCIVMEIFESAVPNSMNQMCYCKEPLTRNTLLRPVPIWRCRSCFANQSGRVMFECLNEECLYKRISRWHYYICSSCFLRDGMDAKEDETQNDFVGSKLTEVLNVIGIFNSCLFIFSLFCLIPNSEMSTMIIIRNNKMCVPHVRRQRPNCNHC